MNFKIGTYIQQDLGSRDQILGEIGQRSRSQGHIMSAWLPIVHRRGFWLLFDLVIILLVHIQCLSLIHI